MKKFEIKDVEKYMVYIYEVEAETKEEALNKYVDELAGAIEPIKEYYDPEEEDIIEAIG